MADVTPATMRAMVWRGDRTVEIAEVPRPSPTARWSIVQPAFTGICGSDLHVCRGELARARPDVIIGHEFVGRLAEDSGDLVAGTPVFVNPVLSCGGCRPCRSGHGHVCDRFAILGIDAPGGAAEEVLVPGASVVALPQDMDLRLAALTEPTAVAVHMNRRGEVRMGDSVTVMGAGPVGVLTALCARLGGASVVLVEPAATRREAAESLGLTTCHPDRASSLPKADVVIDAAGHPSVAAALTGLCRTRGRIVVAGVYSEPPKVDLQDVTFRELTLVGSRVYTREDVDTAIGLLSEARFDALALISEVIELEDAPSALERLASASSMKILIDIAGGRS